MIFGGIFLALAIIGLFLPVFPTTPFLLLSASCFLRSSQKAYRFIMTNKYFGKHIYQYRITKAIPLLSKVSALTVLWVSILVSAIFVPIVWVKIILLVVASGVTIHLILIKTMTAEDKHNFEREYQIFLERNRIEAPQK